MRKLFQMAKMRCETKRSI